MKKRGKRLAIPAYDSSMEMMGRMFVRFPLIRRTSLTSNCSTHYSYTCNVGAFFAPSFTYLSSYKFLLVSSDQRIRYDKTFSFTIKSTCGDDLIVHKAEGIWLKDGRHETLLNSGDSTDMIHTHSIHTAGWRRSEYTAAGLFCSCRGSQ